MDNERDAAGLDVDAGLDVPGLSVRLDRALRIGSLRYFDPVGVFVADLGGVLGGPLPDPLRVTRRSIDAAGLDATGAAGMDATGVGTSATDLMLAWRSPTETIAMTGDAGYFAALAARAAGRWDGCLVDQSSGMCVFTVTGARAPDLMVRLGTTSSIPGLGEARTGRLAELSVMSLCARPNELLLLVERVYSRHLTDWIRETVADF